MWRVESHNDALRGIYYLVICDETRETIATPYKSRYDAEEQRDYLNWVDFGC